MRKSARPTGPNGGTCQTIGTAEIKSNSMTASELRASAPPEQGDRGRDHRDQPCETADQLEGANEGATREILYQLRPRRPLGCRKPIDLVDENAGAEPDQDLPRRRRRGRRPPGRRR